MTNKKNMKEIFIKLAGLIILFLSPIHTLILLITCAIIADTIFGRWAARHEAIKLGIPPREYITSSKTRKGLISKFIGYNSALIFTFMLDKFLLHEVVLWLFPGVPIVYLFTKILGLLIVWIELDSISEKWYRVKGVSLADILISRIKILRSLYKEIKEDTNKPS